MKVPTRQVAWRYFFFLAALEAAAALVVLAIMPREGGAFSPSRLAALGFLLVCAAVAVGLFFRPPDWTTRGAGPWSIFGAAGLSLIVAVALFLLRYLDPERTASIFSRLSVILWFLLCLGVQTVVITLFFRVENPRQGKQRIQAILVPTLVALSSLLVLAGVIVLSGLGLTPDSAYWGEPGVPILGWQLGLSVLAGICVFLLSRHLNRRAQADAYLALGIWILAVVVWLSVPIDVLRNSFYAPMRPPSYQPFPNSDAGYYDSMAHGVLIGEAYQGEIPSRPLYVLLLTGLHALLAERYDLIIAAQTLLLATIPVLLFLLGTVLHSRAAGLMAALASVFRELNSLLVSSQVRVSNTKMLLVDLPTLLMLLACLYFALKWLQRRELRDAVIAGGAFGLLLLLRTQAAITIPITILLGAIVLGWRRRWTYVSIGVFAASTALTITPWLLHNYVKTGTASLDAAFQYRIIASQYQYGGNLDIENIDLRGKGVAESLLAFTLRDPAFVLSFVGSHFFATLIGGFLSLPLFHEYRGLLVALNPYWLDLSGLFTLPNLVLMLGYLAVVSIGLGAAWRRLRLLGLAPLAFSLAYALSNGVARFSGWRYDLPSDWVAYFYLALGMAQLMEMGGALLARDVIRKASVAPISRETSGWRGQRLAVPLVVFISIGFLPWLVEFAAAPRYASLTDLVLPQRLTEAPAVKALGITTGKLDAFRLEPDAVVEAGRILYPRFFTRNIGLASAHPWPAYAPRDFPRMGFLLLNETREDIVLPTKLANSNLEHSADAIVVGCRKGDYIEARMVYLLETGVVVPADAFSLMCQ